MNELFKIGVLSQSARSRNEAEVPPPDIGLAQLRNHSGSESSPLKSASDSAWGGVGASPIVAIRLTIHLASMRLYCWSTRDQSARSGCRRNESCLLPGG